MNVMASYGYSDGEASTDSSSENFHQNHPESSSSLWLLNQQQQDSLTMNNQFHLQFDSETNAKTNGFSVPVPSPHSTSQAFSNLHFEPASLTAPPLVLPPSDKIFGVEEMNVNSYPLLFPSSGSAMRIEETGARRHTHRRFNSDFSYGLMPELQALSVNPMASSCHLDRNFVVGETSRTGSLLKRNLEQGVAEERAQGRNVEDLFTAYMNSGNMNPLNSSEYFVNQKGVSGMEINGDEFSENDEISGSESSMRSREGMIHIAPKHKHHKSLSDRSQRSAYFGEGSLKMAPSQDIFSGQVAAANGGGFGSEFTQEDMKKIMAKEKLTEIATSDPKRATRILANRQSAARSKERKMRYMMDLENKVRTLQAEATSLCAQLTMLQRETTELENHNNELQYRVQAMQQQAQLQDALHSALSTEVQRLKFETMEATRESSEFHQAMMNIQTTPLQQEHRPSDVEPEHHEKQQSQALNGSASATNDPEL